MKTEIRGRTTVPISLPNHSLILSPSSSSSSSNSIPSSIKGCLGSLDGACIEKLLLHCASAIEMNDVTLAQQVMWVLNNVASPVGDPNQRLTLWFLRALISKASKVCPTQMGSLNTSTSLQGIRLLSGTELAGYVDLIPWHRFGFCAANSAIFKAVQGCSRVHILDFSITHCMQWPTLIDALAKRPEGPPSLRISVPCSRPHVPPFLNVSIEDVGIRLANFARLRDIQFRFDLMNNIHSPNGDKSSSEMINVKDDPLHFNIDSLLDCLNPHALNIRDDEVLVVNCQNWLRYLSNDQSMEGSTSHSNEASSCSIRDTFLDLIRSLNPNLVIIVDEDADLNSKSLTSRIATCFNYLWIPFDALDTFLPKDSSQRIEYEADIGHKIENIIGFDGLHRIERLESSLNTSQRAKNKGFFSVPFSEDTLKEVKVLLDEHASGWGMKIDEDALILTWKGHNSMYATAWVTSGLSLCD